MVRMHRHQSLAEHSYRVALYASRIASRLHGDAALTSEDWCQLYMWALCHDLEELDYGDVPTVTKKQFGSPDLGKAFWEENRLGIDPSTAIDEGIKMLVKCADILESYFHYQEYGYRDTNHGKYIEEQLFDALDKYASELQFRGQPVWPIILTII